MPRRPESFGPNDALYYGSIEPGGVSGAMKCEGIMYHKLHHET